MTFAEKVIQYNKHLEFKGTLPHGVNIMNPFKENPQANSLMEQFYTKYYNDGNQRHMILGINPGRFGGGVTGIPFTDSKRLKAVCGINYEGKETHEPSSVFVYEVIEAFGGLEAFYNHIYINSVCPLGFTATTKTGKEVNYNYYDSKELTNAVYDFIVENIRKQIDLGNNTDTCFCFGTGKNETFLRRLNDEHGFFKNIVALEHPRFIMQYKSKTKQQYIEKYIAAFKRVI
ncbi:uracil-DNA glycosylase family protein [Mucilaginibacter xinganensis]|uniref:DUF4918 domain-containing protein n=1 Tax=Mucilaginibacter xinganensis TaxID=1234841 RepID=A0A223NU57_9SPHI|nr:uracil-DNA glycosylase family protein [Mucilaginibacter xinganensis]ASU33041.1 DUF4918 domain-containing protein [Mucilaginibacter xinganensis]